MKQEDGLSRCPRCVKKHSLSHKSTLTGRTDLLSPHSPDGENKQGSQAAGSYDNYSNEGE